MSTESEIVRLARSGFSPADIEKFLGIEPYTIHKKYHGALMEGYMQTDPLLTEPSKKVKAPKRNSEKRKEYLRRYYKENREKIIERQKKRYFEDLESSREASRINSRKYYENHKEKCKASSRAQRLKNVEKFNEKNRIRCKAYYYAHKEEINKRQRERRKHLTEEQRERIRKSNRASYQRNKERVSEKRRELRIQRREEAAALMAASEAKIGAMQMTTEEKIKYIADHYGIDVQILKLAEECGEYAAAMLKVRVYSAMIAMGHNEAYCREKGYEAADNSLKELADVLVVAKQINYLLESEPTMKADIDKYIGEKLDRQILRIKEEQLCPQEKQ